MNNIAGESGGKAMSRIYGNIGFRGLWNGLPVRIVMVCSLNLPSQTPANMSKDWNIDGLSMANL